MRNETIVGTIGAILIALLLFIAGTQGITDTQFVDDYGSDYGAILFNDFEEGTGTVTYDQSPYANHGTITNATWAPGKYGMALSFDGNDYVNVLYSDSLNISDYITIEAWGRDPPLEREPSIVGETGEIDYVEMWKVFETLVSYEGCRVEVGYNKETRKSNLVVDSVFSTKETVGVIFSSKLIKVDSGETWVLYEYEHYQFNYSWADAVETVKDLTYSMLSNRLELTAPTKVGEKLEIDPATVGTSTKSDAVRHGYMRKGFYAEGLFWAFYSDGTNAGWEFSSDGTTWMGAFTGIGACAEGYKFSIWFDGTYISYARYDFGVTYDLFYRRGTPENDGTITWSAVEQTVYDGAGANDNYNYPCITVDTNGFAWISVYNDQPDGDDFPVVVKNDNNDGTWATDFTTELSAVDSTSWRVAVVPLTDGKIYVIYLRNNQFPLGKLYDAGWGGEENTITDYKIEYSHQFSVVALSDNVHIVYNRVWPDYQIRHNERVWGVGWDANDVLVEDPVTGSNAPALSSDPSTGDLYCFWTSTVTDHVYYRQYTGGAWQARVDWVDETADDITQDYLISSFYQDYGGYIGLFYVTETGSPYKVRFTIVLEPPPPPSHKVIVEKIGSYTLYINYTSFVFAKIDTTEVRYNVPVVTDWHYYAMTYDNVTLKLYMDGILVNSTALTGAIPFNANDVTIGTRFVGEIDQVRIYNVAKTVGEIKNHYINSKGMYSRSVVISDDFRVLNSTLNEELQLDEYGLDLNQNYLLNTPLDTWIHIGLTAGVADIQISSIPAGLHTQDKHYYMLHVGLDAAPGGGKEVNVTISNGVDSLIVVLAGAVENNHTMVTAFDWDASAQTLTLDYGQTAGGASSEACVMMHWWYIETP